MGCLDGDFADLSYLCPMLQLKARFLVERSLLFDAFQQRGLMEFQDELVPGIVGQKEKESGTSFVTADIPGKRTYDTDVPSYMEAAHNMNTHEWRAENGCLSYTGVKFAGSYIVSAVEVYYKKSRGIIGIVLVVCPGEFSSGQVRLPVAGHTSGSREVFMIQPYERIIRMDVSVGIVLEQLRCV